MKQTFYFTHDYNAQNDPKIIKLRMKHGWKGYGIFWALIELLSQEENSKLPKDYDSISFQLREETKLIKAIIEDFNLFVNDDTFFYSKRLIEHKNKRKEISEQRAKAGKKGGLSNSKANAKQLLSKVESKSSKVKESKVKENKINSIPDFSEFKEFALSKDSTIDIKALHLKYEAWKENNWQDGNNQKIKNWKSKLLNTLPYIPKLQVDKQNKAQYKKPTILKPNSYD